MQAALAQYLCCVAQCWLLIWCTRAPLDSSRSRCLLQAHLLHLALGKPGDLLVLSRGTRLHRTQTSPGPAVRWPQRTPTRGRPSDLSSCANRAAPTRVLAGDAEPPPPPPPPRPSVRAPELDFCFLAASPQIHSAAASASAPRRPSHRGPRTPRPDAALADRRRPRAAGPGRGNPHRPGGGAWEGQGVDRGRGLRRRRKWLLRATSPLFRKWDLTTNQQGLLPLLTSLNRYVFSA